MKKAVLTIIGLLIFSIGVYYWMGGFEPVIIQENNQPVHFTISGKEYKGKYRPSEFRKEMGDIGELQKDFPESVISAIFYENDTIKDDEAHYFIGLTNLTENNKLPNDFKTISYESAGSYFVEITKHPIVRPSPATILEKIKQKADEANASLHPFSIEQYFNNGEVKVEVLVR